LSNKCIQTYKDVAMVLLTLEKKFPYIFNAATLIELCNKKATKLEVE
jgi:hypothetical protein